MKGWPISVVICKHGSLGYTVSVRFANSKFDREYSYEEKEMAYDKVDYLFKPERYRDWQ